MSKVRMKSDVRIRHYNNYFEDNVEYGSIDEVQIQNTFICNNSRLRVLISEMRNWLRLLFGPREQRTAYRFILKYLAPVIPAGHIAYFNLKFVDGIWKIYLCRPLFKVIPLSGFGIYWTWKELDAFSASLHNRFIMDKNEYALEHIVFSVNE